MTAELAHEAALAGDPLCIELLGAAGRRVGYALVGLVHLFNPEVVVLGGGVTGAGDLFWGLLRETFWGGLIPAFAEGLRLKKSALGDHAVLYGAATLALRNVGDAPERRPPMRPPSSARAKEADRGERNEGARVDLALRWRSTSGQRSCA